MLISVILWRGMLFLVSYIAQKLFSFTPSFPYSDVYLIPSQLPQWIWAWANFDGVHYLTIAKHGYWAQFTQAFFPLYPILMSLVAKVCRDEHLILSGLLISGITFYLGIKILVKLLRLDYESYQVKKAVLMLLIFPTAFYFGALYTESLFFMLVVGAFYFARKKRWWWSGILALFASMTRLTGIFLWPALLWEWIRSNDNQFLNVNISKTFKTISTTLYSPVLYLPPIGLASYMLYLQHKFADWLYFWHAQPVFGAERSGGTLIFPLQVFWRYIKMLISVPMHSYQFKVVVWEFASVALVIILLLQAHRLKVRSSYLIFSWLTVLVPMLTGTFSSMPRYVLMAFPIYIVLGLNKNKTIYLFFALSFFILLFIFLPIFIRGLWVA